MGALLEAGIEIYEYQAGLLHAKTMTVDGIWATIGSTNPDTRSLALNEELNAVLYDKDVAGQLEKIFADDLTYSRRSTTRRGGAEGSSTDCSSSSPFRFASRCSGARTPALA